MKIKHSESSIETKTVKDKQGSFTVVSKKESSPNTSISGSVSMGLFGLIISILLGIAVIRMLAGYEGLSFASLLEALANAPNIQMSLSSSMQIIHIGGEWAILDGLRRFINTLGSMFGVSIWCCQGLLQCITYFIYFLGFIFVG